jgi:hypothetical protein
MTLGELIRAECPRYLAMGLSWDDYWHGDYAKLPYYRKAHALRRNERNEELWMLGIYFLRAIGAILPKSELSYPSEPFALTQEEVEDQEKRQKEKEIADARAYMETMMHNINKKRRERGDINGRDGAA